MTAKQQTQIGTAPAACRSADRTSRFMARIDAHLPRLADDRERRAFLARQLEGWECRYARFIATQGASEFAASTRDPPHAADFLLTITALAARAAAFGPPRREAQQAERIAPFAQRRRGTCPRPAIGGERAQDSIRILVRVRGAPPGRRAQ
jgi:hypothetical protein